MMIFADWSKWNRGHPVLFLGWVTPVTRVAMRATWVSPGNGYGPKGRTRWRKLGGEWCCEVFCDWAHRCCEKTQSFLLPNLWQGRVWADSWSPRNIAALPGRQTFSPQPTFEVGDARLGSAGLWGKRHESSRNRATTVEDNEGSFGRESQGVPILRGRPWWRNWCGGPESWGDGESFLLIEVLRLGRSYELVYHLWVQFTLSAVRVNVDVTWSRDEVLVSSYTLLRIFYVALCIQSVDCFSPSSWMGCIREVCLAV